MTEETIEQIQELFGFIAEDADGGMEATTTEDIKKYQQSILHSCKLIQNKMD